MIVVIVPMSQSIVNVLIILSKCENLSDLQFRSRFVFNFIVFIRLTEPYKICDGIPNCSDKKDEDPNICPCQPNKFQCLQ